MTEPVRVLTAKILLVDDKVANLLVLEAILDELGESLVRASSGEEALKLLDQDDFAVILLDVQMPTMSGFETARRTRCHPRANRTPIMFLTATSEADFSTDEAYALGAVDFMSKPLVPAVLKAKVAIFVDLYRKTHELALAERVKAAAEMSAKDERLRLILDNTTDYGFILANVQGEITEWEGGAAAVTGWRADEAIGRPISFIFTSEDREGRAPQLEMERSASAGRAPARRWHIRKDGGRFFADGVMVGLRGTDGALRGYAKIFRDSTAEHLGAVELEAARDREHRAADDLRQLAADLSEANRRKTEFLAVLAHELRNPLAPIRNGLQIMKLVDDAPISMTKARDMMDRQLTHLVSLVDDLLDVARVTQGKFHLKKVRMELGAAVTAAIEASTPLIELSRHALTVHLPHEALLLDADPTRLTQIFSNLLNNAAKYTAPGGRVDVDVHRDGNEAVVAIKDTGIGLSPSSIISVFDMFTQVDGQGESPQSGLGIGLSLVRSLVELHGGKVEVTSPGEGLGSIFEVRLPLALPQQSDGFEGMASNPGVNAGKTYRILVVDDNIDAADSLAVLLQSQGHAVNIAYDGLAALALAQEYKPEVVILDIGMPRMNGYEVAAALRKSPGVEDAVLIALTGWGTQEDRLRSQHAGFDHHLIKPASPAVLSSLIAGLDAKETAPGT